MTAAEILKLAVLVQRIIDGIIQRIIDKEAEEKRQALASAISEARKARTSDEAQAAAKRITEVMRGNYRPGSIDGGSL